MALDYHQNDRLNKILDVIDEYVTWYVALSQAVCTQTPDLAALPAMPPLFPDEEVADGYSYFAAPDQLTDLKQKSTNLLDIAQNIVTSIKENKENPDAESFQKVTTAFDAFLKALRALRDTVFHDERGLDDLSGLKNKGAMYRDMTLEMERLARQGQPFSLAIARIDGFQEMEDHLDAQSVEKYIRIASDVVQKSLRPFDDAYYADENEFVLCMRQSDLSGGVRAFERFGEELEKANSTYVIAGEERPLTMSSCIAEPLAGDDINDLLDNLRKDIESQEKTQGAAFTYHEMSPLQRYVKSNL